MSATSLVKESLAVCQTCLGVEIRASLLRLTRYQAVIEVYNPALILRTSEVLNDFKIVLHDRTIYSGRAVVSSTVNAGTMIVCEVKLDESGFCVASLSPLESNGTPHGFDDFLREWQRLYKVLPEFKVVIADMQTFLTDLRLWLDQIELEVRSAPAGDRIQMERDLVEKFGQSMVPAFTAIHERLEELSGGVEEELRPVHQNFSKRQLHPLVLCSPFAYRTYHKPLGYAGDYEMVNMIVRDPCEGGSLFAKIVNLWFLNQWPARAHRNRIQYLRERLRDETLRGMRSNKPIRVLNLGCGPAKEVQQFLEEDALSDLAQLTLWDFNDETIRYATKTLDELKRRFSRRTSIQVQKKSVHQVLKDGTKPIVGLDDKRFDLIYCAGLFDYLSDRTCKQLMTIFYDWLAPGGLLTITNVDDCKPFRHMLEFVLDWHLIYRDQKHGASLVPDRAGKDSCRVMKDPTEVNVFVEVRKPENG
jgi:extracellular factor (EF) 3-hydroxypalmitic acid methyl ester biosynthesis protein